RGGPLMSSAALLQSPDLAAHVDWRESLANARATGPITEVSIPQERITGLHGILLDVDPRLLKPGNPFCRPAHDPRRFLPPTQPVPDRHPLAHLAEVRASGTGLHIIMWLEPAVELYSELDQARWDAAVKVIQSTLPTDPNAPGITALTRPLQSINSKNG